MARVNPLDRSDLPEFEPLFRQGEQMLGFVPNSMLIMGRRPEILRAFNQLAGSVIGSGEVPVELKQLIAFVSSNASGCRYCQAHTSKSAAKAGGSTDRVAAAFEYETSPLFSEAERAALRLAQHASLVPCAATDADFEELHEHWTDAQIVEICAAISLFGWLNRWNDMLATELEAGPVEFARKNLAVHGWEGAKHGA